MTEIRLYTLSIERMSGGVVLSKPDHALVVLSILCNGHERQDERYAHQQVVLHHREQHVVQLVLQVSLLDLLDRLGVVVWRYSYISAIDDLQPRGGRVDL